ncbi:thioredoxin domain-containing protein [Limimaricola litoreus]|uniref:Thioredoxin family protein n=1 Tax=Limimaricola litoreus TaxID=2955316 RepID=A0A9X2JN89_9RHOB|nr:thioredoxin family protein [Limimaricola litoreus]MCP1168013.1 thioredoxin family protein [Limimaricola litoreus]
MSRLAILALGLALALPAAPLRAELELVMAEEAGCPWCARWTAEIGPVYPKTDEGRAAPLRRIDIRDLPGDLDLDRRVVFTPTFLLVDDGTEIGRIEGYPGEDFFWGLLGRLIEEASVTAAPQG